MGRREKAGKKERATCKRIWKFTPLTATGRNQSDRNEKDDEQNKKDTLAKGKI